MTPSIPRPISLEYPSGSTQETGRASRASDAAALARVHAQLPAPTLPLSSRDAQLVLAREYGSLAGWLDLRAAVLRLEGNGLASAAAEAERAVHGSSSND